MPTLKIDHDYCTECRMCYIACRDIDINAVYVALEPLHRIEIDAEKCTYPGCTVCLVRCARKGRSRRSIWSPDTSMRYGQRSAPAVETAWNTVQRQGLWFNMNRRR